MFQATKRDASGLVSALTLFQLIYHATVRSIRKTHNNAFAALLINVLQTVIFVLAFYLLFSLLGLRRASLRGDFLLYIMSGIFLFMTHTKTLNAVVKSEGPASPMMQHAPMNTVIAIASSALGSLYIQVMSLCLILGAYHVIFQPVVIEDPVGAFGMLMVAWFTGVALGVVLLAVKPWYPQVVNIFSTIYQRANMFASGKMFVANTLPGSMLALFDWNPLFHSIDQARGFIFINYNPHYTDWRYAVWVGVVLLMIGLMGEFYTRRHASLSWSARR
ncbi:ABC transporter permease [Roseobacter cerasinus]|uniref:ABC transporter permease n=1 Tax=Roseobacter cerasinus TaxID=2602289 RepID=A0A640VPD3_9RHOB|nr:ABC transporter permease [Roseobacter cerasinus]GFE49300.1 ABC transporter permease [Roseobacter cerasinus]